MPRVGQKSRKPKKIRKGNKLVKVPKIPKLREDPNLEDAITREILKDAGRVDKRREARQKANDIKVGPLPKENYERRTLLEENDLAWLIYYIPDMFHKPDWWEEEKHTWRDLLDSDLAGEWTPMRRGLVEDINFVGKNGGYTCSAAYRGGGKTTIAEGMALKGVVEGTYRHIAIIAANGPFAENIMNNIKAVVEESEHFIEDYPEVSLPVLGLEGALNRVMTQTANNERTRMKWSGSKIIFPTVIFAVEGFEEPFLSRASGSVMQTRGFDAPMRGLKHKGIRLELLIIDDPDETGETDEKTKKKMEKLDTELANLGGDRREMAVIMLCNTPKAYSIGNIYSDPAIKHEWRGKKYPFCTKRPDDLTLPREYVERRKNELFKIGRSKNKLRLPRETDQWFEDNWDELHEGWEFDNPKRFFGSNGIDGKPKEYSALHRYLNAVCKANEQAILMEWDLQPPEIIDPESEGFNAVWFAERHNELGEFTALPGSDFYNITVDCGKYELHYKFICWVKQKGTDQCKSHVMYRGSVATGITRDMRQGIEIMFFAALCDLYDTLMQYEVRTPSGRTVPLGKYGIDAGYLTQQVYEFKKEKRSNKIVPLMGTKDANTPKEFQRLVGKERNDVKLGMFQEYRLKEMKNGMKVWLKLINTTYWKTWVRNRWSTSIGNLGCRTIWKPETFNEHLRWGEHMANPKWDSEKKLWHTPKSKPDHWSDCDYYDAALAADQGVRLPLKKPEKVTEEKKARTYAKPVRRAKKTMKERMAKNGN